jgi:hypothetical protein
MKDVLLVVLGAVLGATLTVGRKVLLDPVLARLAEQAEVSYQQMVRDWQAGAPKKVGASVTPGRASQKPLKGKVARQTTSP